MHTKILGSLTALVVLLAAPTATAGNVSPEKFAARAGDMAKAAAAAYKDGEVGSVALTKTGEGQSGTIQHDLFADWSTDVVQAFKATADENIDPSVIFSLVVSFRGTQAKPTAPVVATGDLLRDLQGAVIRVRPSNPWIADQPSGVNIGQGFNRRVVNYMNSGQGEKLKTRLARLPDEVKPDNSKVVEIHITGHSLGAISSQIFAFYLTQYIRTLNLPADRVRINNFAFNTPRGVGENFANLFAAEIDADSLLTAYTFTIAGDPVSDWTLSWLRGALIDAAPAGYCAHAHFPALDPSNNPIKKLNNHWLDDDAIFKFGGVTNYAEIDPNLPQCMADGYFSFI
ncbi:MAG: hypothetical protein AB1Z98_07445 [Nannocystaceae bacterium]